MSAIANFKKRREAAKAQQQNPSNQYAASTPVPENEALQLLAALLYCDKSVAITNAKIIVEKGGYIAGLTEAQLNELETQIYIDLASGPDKGVIAQVTHDDAGNITAITELSDSVNSATDSVTDAAGSVTYAADKVEQSANAIDDSASDLAYSADSIANAANDIKEATAELKKPSAAPASSHGEKAVKPKNNSKK
jgi:methyl-accepting chemotaxis protein